MSLTFSAASLDPLLGGFPIENRHPSLNQFNATGLPGFRWEYGDHAKAPSYFLYINSIIGIFGFHFTFRHCNLLFFSPTRSCVWIRGFSPFISILLLVVYWDFMLVLIVSWMFHVYIYMYIFIRSSLFWHFVVYGYHNTSSPWLPIIIIIIITRIF